MADNLTGTQIKELLERERSGKLSSEAQAAIGQLRNEKRFPPPLGPKSGTDLMREGIIGSGLGTQTYGTTTPAMEDPPGFFKREIFPLVLGTAASLIPGPGGPVTRAVGRTAAGAMGTMIGSEMAAEVFEGVPKPTPGELVARGVTSGAVDLAAQGVVGAGRQIARAGTVEPRPDAQRVLGAMRETGVEPKMTDVTSSRLPAVAERSLAQHPTAQGIISQAAERQAAALNTAADDFLGRLGGSQAQSAEQTGLRASEAIRRQVERSAGVENHLWSVMAQTAHDEPVQITGLKQAALNILNEQERRLPTQRNPRMVRLMNEIQAAPDQVSWQAVDSWRRGFGEMISDQRGALISTLPVGQAKLLYSAALRDMEQTAGSAPGLAQQFSNVRAYSERRRALFRDGDVADIVNTPPEKIVRLLSPESGPTFVRNARDSILGSPQLGQVAPNPADVEAWNIVRRHIFEGVLGPSEAGGARRQMRGMDTRIINAGDLERRLARMGPETLNELLTPTEQRALENIRTVAGAIRTGERLGSQGQSITSQVTQFGALFGLPGVAAGAVTGSPTIGSVAGITSYLFAPPVVARILTDPRAAAFVASPQFAQFAQTAARTGQISGEGLRLMGRVAAILATRPEGSTEDSGATATQ